MSLLLLLKYILIILNVKDVINMYVKLLRIKMNLIISCLNT